MRKAADFYQKIENLGAKESSVRVPLHSTATASDCVFEYLRILKGGF